ncbi:MAG: hypothetical protein ACXW08_16605 [Solirubrobacteraceae bacterium]
MRRAKVAIVVGFIVFVFLGLAVLLGRGLTGSISERADVLDLVEAQAAGDADAALAQLPACRAEPPCAQLVRERVSELRKPGEVEILTYDPSVQVALTNRTGIGRVAWRAGRSLPVVQCVRVRRDGPLTGADVELLSISAPIGREAGC